LSSDLAVAVIARATLLVNKMESPSKRRKKNDSKPVQVAHRNLDFFFRKQDTPASEPKSLDLRNENDEAQPSPERVQNHTVSKQGLTDEELARKLQEEWAKEDGQQSGIDGQSNGDSPSRPVGDQAHKAEEDVKDFVTAALDHDSAQPQPASKETKKGVLGLQSTASEEDTITLTIPFDQSPLTFNPSEYASELQKHWAADKGEASYALLTRCFVLVNSTQSRIKIVDTLVNCLRVLIEADPDSLLPAVWLATNSISPPYISLELGLGGSAISKALKKICGLDSAGLKNLYDKHGDAGDVAFEAKKRQSFTLRKPKPLTIKSAYQTLVKIANSKGHGSVEQKQRLVERLLQDARGPEESRYIVRTLVQHLRIGAVKTTMLIALARAFQLSRPHDADFPVKDPSELAKLKKEELAIVWSRAEEVVKTCFARRPNYNDLVPALLEVGVSDELLLRCCLALHIPLRPMLGSITRDLSEMLTKLQGRDFSCEFKYDGQRAQVHCDEHGKVSIFSRHLEVMTDKYPDLVALVPEIRGDGVSSFILEGEVVAVDRNSGELKTFQTLTNRARKDVDIGSIQVDVCLFAFDLMYLNGEQLLDRPFRERRGLLRSMFIEKDHHFTWVQSIDATSSDSDTVLEFFKSATDVKCEGIMVKVLDNLSDSEAAALDNAELVGEDQETAAAPTTPSKRGKKTGKKTTPLEKQQEKEKGTRRKALLSTYEPDKRLDSWLKVKKDYATSADTIDLIPVAGWHGQGRKAKWWSPILLACRNPETGSLEVVTKCISGFTDKFYQANKEKYAEDGDNTLGSRPSYVEYSAYEPDVWFEPQEVWEMAFADITLSPTYTAAIGLVSEDRGLSMRFPRFLKVREDKGIEEASTSEFLANLYRKQEARIQATGQTPGEADAAGDEDKDLEE
jgi:DNA ligase-1